MAEPQRAAFVRSQTAVESTTAARMDGRSYAYREDWSGF